MNQKEWDNANQKNPNHSSYWTSRGYCTRPHNWRDLIDSDEYDSDDDDRNKVNQTNSNHKSLMNWRGASDSDDDVLARIPRLSNGLLSRSYSNNVSAYGGGTATRDNSLEKWATGGAIVGAGAFTLAKIIIDACNESKESSEQERQRRN